MNDLHDIYEHDGDKDTLLGLAEECSELSTAALKLVRAIEGKTPKSKDICVLNFLEEFADVECMMVTIGNAPWFRVDVVDDIYNAKVERWRKRIKQFDKTGSMAGVENNEQAVADLGKINASIEHEKKIADTFAAIGKLARKMMEEADFERSESLRCAKMGNDFAQGIVDAIMSSGKEINE